MNFRYWFSKLVPVRMKSKIYGVVIPKKEVDEGGHGNHFRSETHQDAETATWWQWRDRTWRHRTTRMCLP